MPDIAGNEVQNDHVWMPQDVQRAIGCDYLPVILYDDAKEAEARDDCLSSRHVGMTHIRLGTGRNILICLTTADKIIVIDMTIPSHRELLEILLREPDVEFFAMRGQYLAYSLKLDFKIDLKSTLDLSSFDIFLSTRRASLNGLLPEYTMTRISSILDDVKYRDRVDLAKYWLDVDLPSKDTIAEKHETQVVRMARASVAAKNVIRKRSCLTRALGLKMRHCFDGLTFQDADNLYEFAHKVTGTRYTEYENLCDGTYATVIDFLKKQEQY